MSAVFSGRRRVLRIAGWTLLEEMNRTRTASFMLVAAGEEASEVAFNQRFARVIGDRAELWVVPGVRHTGARSRYPDEYERRVVGFLDARLSP